MLCAPYSAHISFLLLAIHRGILKCVLRLLICFVPEAAGRTFGKADWVKILSSLLQNWPDYHLQQWFPILLCLQHTIEGEQSLRHLVFGRCAAEQIADFSHKLYETDQQKCYTWLPFIQYLACENIWVGISYHKPNWFGIGVDFQDEAAVIFSTQLQAQYGVWIWIF